MPDFPLLSGGGILDNVSNPATSGGVNIAAGGVAHVEGATWTQLIASTTAAANWMVVTLIANPVGRYFVDIGIGASTAEKVIAADLFTEKVVTQEEGDRSYLLPVSIPSGSRISARVQSSVASASVDVLLHLVTGTMRYPSGAAGIVQSMGLTQATTRPAIVDPGGVANTVGAWVELSASTTCPISWLIIAMGHGADTTGLAAFYMLDVGVGAAGSEKLVIPQIPTKSATVVDTHPNVPFYPVSIPAASRLAVRARCSSITATSRIIDVCAYGVG